MTLLVVAVMALFGILGLLAGRLPVSLRESIRGARARWVGAILLLPLPLMIGAGFTLGLWLGFTSSMRRTPLSSQIEWLALYGEVAQTAIIIGLLLIATLIAYWPKRQQLKPKASDSFSDFLPDLTAASPVENVTVPKAAAELSITENEVINLAKAGQLKAVKTLYGIEITGTTFSALLQRKRGVEHAQKDNFAEAIDALNTSIRLNPLPTTYLLRGKIYLKAGELEAAQADFRRVQEMTPENQEAATLLARTTDPAQIKAAQAQTKARSSSALLFSTLGRHIRQGPVYLAFAVLVMAITIITTIPVVREIASRNCMEDRDCRRVAFQQTATAAPTYNARQTRIAAPTFAANQTKYAIQTATAYPTFVVRQTEISINQTNEANLRLTATEQSSQKTATAYPTFVAQQTQAFNQTSTAYPAYATEQRAMIQMTNAALEPKLALTGRIIVVKDYHVIVMDTKGENQRTFDFRADTDSIWSAAWSPTSSHIVFTSGGGWIGVYTARADGSGVKQLTPDMTLNADPVWSWDEKSIALASNKDSPGGSFNDLYTMLADGSNWKRLTTQIGNVVSPSWSPDNKSLFFCVDKGGAKNIYTVNVDGTDLRQLTTDDASCSPAVSPDGQHIAFVHGGPRFWDLKLMNSSGSDIKQLTTCIGGKPAWSPDGNYIVFRALTPVGNCDTSVYGHIENIFIYDTTTSKLYNITRNKEMDIVAVMRDPSWGP